MGEDAETSLLRQILLLVTNTSNNSRGYALVEGEQGEEEVELIHEWTTPDDMVRRSNSRFDIMRFLLTTDSVCISFLSAYTPVISAYR